MGDKKLDPYRVRAMKLFNVAYDEVTKTQRDWAKRDMYIKIYSLPLPLAGRYDLHR